MLTLFLIAASALHLLADDPQGLIQLNDDGAWCWFQDERALIHKNKLIFGSVAGGVKDKSRRGDIDLTVFDLKTKTITRTKLHHRLQADDHNVAGLLLRPDGRLLAIYSKHGPENKFYYRISQNDDFTQWGAINEFTPSEKSQITYSNPHFLKEENQTTGRVYNFFRGLDGTNKPSYVFSDDLGQTWATGNIVISFPSSFKHRPYVKYSSDGKNTIHLLYTDAHPRNFNNNVYHIFYRNGFLHRSDGSKIRSLKKGLKNPGEGTLIFRGNSNNIGWTSDLHLSPDGRPYAVCTVRKNSEGQSVEQFGNDLRYHYAWWDGNAWHNQEIAYAGSRLYPREFDYTGNICLDPDNLNHVFISTNADPVTGDPLISQTDGKRHYEIFHGITKDKGNHFSWKAITKNSTGDNLRPLVPTWNVKQSMLLWYRGSYRTYTDFDTEVVGIILKNTSND
ncbi:MAG: BNR-4 repeat-containing protein [Verrucomicrobiota bacterium]